jgi:hypothetical protein
MKSPATHFIGMLIVTGVTLAGYWGWYMAISEKSNEVANLEQKIQEKADTLKNITLARTALVEISKDEEKVQSYFIPDTDPYEFINTFPTFGDAQRAKITVLSVAMAGSSTQPILTLSAMVTGTFDAVMRTIGVIEYAPYAISISNLSVQQNVGNAWQANLSLVVGAASKNVRTITP